LIDTVREGERREKNRFVKFNKLVLSILINEMIKIIIAKSLRFVTFSLVFWIVLSVNEKFNCHSP